MTNAGASSNLNIHCFVQFSVAMNSIFTKNNGNEKGFSIYRIYFSRQAKKPMFWHNGLHKISKLNAKLQNFDALQFFSKTFIN